MGSCQDMQSRNILNVLNMLPSSMPCRSLSMPAAQQPGFLLHLATTRAHSEEMEGMRSKGLLVHESAAASLDGEYMKSLFPSRGSYSSTRDAPKNNLPWPKLGSRCK